MAKAHLTLNGEPLAELEDVQPDMPWFTARFVPTEAFATVAQLFREEREMSERSGFDVEAWQTLWEEIWARGVALVLSDQSLRERDFAVHVYDDGTARFRY